MGWFPTSWLTKKLSPTDANAELTADGDVHENWLEEWRRFLGSMREGDELWEYCSPPETWEGLHGRAGYAIVRDGEIVDDLLTILN